MAPSERKISMGVLGQDQIRQFSQKKKKKLACLWKLLRGEEPGQKGAKISGQPGGTSVDFPEGIPEVALCLLEADQNMYLLFGNKYLDPVEPAPKCTD